MPATIHAHQRFVWIGRHLSRNVGERPGGRDAELAGAGEVEIAVSDERLRDALVQRHRLPLHRTT